MERSHDALPLAQPQPVEIVYLEKGEKQRPVDNRDRYGQNQESNHRFREGREFEA
jgi:hypothetical protein